MNWPVERNSVKKKFNWFIKVSNKNVRPVREQTDDGILLLHRLLSPRQGIVNEETFKHIYGQFFPFADTSSYAHLVFATFDLRSSGCVTFEDFLVCLSTLCRGSLEDRLRWIFTLYDTKKSGKLTRDVRRRDRRTKRRFFSLSGFSCDCLCGVFVTWQCLYSTLRFGNDARTHGDRLSTLRQGPSRLHHHSRFSLVLFKCKSDASLFHRIESTSLFRNPVSSSRSMLCEPPCEALKNSFRPWCAWVCRSSVSPFSSPQSMFHTRTNEQTNKLNPSTHARTHAHAHMYTSIKDLLFFLS